jgi:GTPase SAR1 family protein
MIVNDKATSITNKSTTFKTTMGHSSVTSSEAFTSRLKKRKIIILGKMGAGKSSILKRFVDNTLPDKPSMTIEETFIKNYYYKNEETKLILLDTAGQSEYTPALPNRYCVGKT